MNNIQASNFDLDMTEQTIRGLFIEFGVVERVKLMTDRKTAQPTGVAFIEMANDTDAQRAIEAINGAELNGRILKVNAARPQLHRTAAGHTNRKKRT